MGIKRIVDTDFWTDDKVMMDFSPEDRLFMLYLLTNPHTTQLGVYKILPKQMAFELGYSSDTINVLLDRFETKYNMIRYSKATSEIAVRNYLKYSIVKGGKPVLDLLTREANRVKDKALIAYINESASLSENATVKEFCELFNDNENENDNDNDNEDSYHESSTNRTTNRPRFVPPTLEEVTAYVAERKSKVIPQAFIDFYAAKGWMVGKNKMKDWKSAVRTWEKNNYSTSNKNDGWCMPNNIDDLSDLF
jgi:hypothetical protein